MTFMDELLASQLLPTEKGMPPVAGLRLLDIGAQNWNLLDQDTSFPIALLRERALLGNVRWMQRFAESHSLWLYPHGKTTMAPQLFALQLAHGCRGITAANPTHAEVYLRSGVHSVFLANQVTGRQALRRLAMLCESYPEAELFLIVDSEFNAREIAVALGDRVSAGQIKLLIELGAAGGRTGLRTAAEVCDLAAFMTELHVPVSGLEAFEGVFDMQDPARAEERVGELLQEMLRAYTLMEERELFAGESRYVSAGGSWFYDLVARNFQDLGGQCVPQLIVRAGCTITHDSGVCARAYLRMRERGFIDTDDRLQQTLEVWAQVQSNPEPGRAFANAGKRDLSHDIELPVVRWWYRPGLHEAPQAVDGNILVSKLNDHHAYLSYDPKHSLQVGDLLGFGISHPCTTFDKWKYLFTVDDDYTLTGAIKTFF